MTTTAYHPQCNGMVERMNRTLKPMLHKHAARFIIQWDEYLPGVLWACRNAPHDSTQEKPSFLLFGVDLRTPTALLPSTPLEPADVAHYREELMLSLSAVRVLATVCKAQARYRKYYELVRFPAEESGHLRKLSRPWHGPYRIQK